MNKIYQIIWEGYPTTAGADYRQGDIVRLCETLEEAEMELPKLVDDFGDEEEEVAFSIKTIYTPSKK